MITWDGTIVRVDGVAILDAEARRGETVRIAWQRDAEGKASYSINPPDGSAAEALWQITIPAAGPVTAAIVRQEA